MRPVLLSLCAAAGLFAQNQLLPPHVTATATAEVKAQPDQAVIDVGVFSRAKTAQDAAAANAKQLSAVLGELKKAFAASAEIKTTGYSLNPEYFHPREGGAPSITGYTASNTVEVTLKDVTAVGKVIDVATKAGANNIHSIRFRLQNQQKVKAEALALATKDARASAEAMAAALGLKPTGVLSAIEGSGDRPQPTYEAAMRVQASMPTPIEAGTILVQSTVTVTLGVGRQ